jgi:hypothetical protein
MGGKQVRKHGRVQDDLPLEIRHQVDRLLIEGGSTYDDIKAFLAESGYDISRSAIGRYGKDFMGTYQRLRIIEDKSRALVSEVGDGMILEEAASKLFAQKIIEAQMDGSLDIKELPRIISDFARLQASVVLREKLKSEIRKKADKAVEDIERKTGKDLSPETLQYIKEHIYGIVS